VTSLTAKRVVCVLVIFCALDWASSVRAQISIGTWVLTDALEGVGKLSMTIEACCGSAGRRIVYRVVGHDDVFMSIDSAMDGSEAPVLVGGKPTGETMAIKRVDDHHAVSVLRMNGKMFGTSKATISADGKTLTVENEITDAVQGHRVGKRTETWQRK
jgi:hypothetical protein